MIYGYTRVSTSEQTNGSSLDEQEQRIRGCALIRGVAPDHIFCDAGVSGGTPVSERPSGGRMMQVLERGDLLIVSKLDRMFRDLLDAVDTIRKLEKRGVDIIMIDMGVEPVCKSAAGKLQLNILAVFAEFERDRIRERIMEGKRAKRDRGGWGGGTVPFGFAVSDKGRGARLVPFDPEMDVIRKIEMFVNVGTSFRNIARQLNANGMTNRGALWSHHAIARILQREAA